MAASRDALAVIEDLWREVLAAAGEACPAEARVVIPFGSTGYGAVGDVDVVCLCPCGLKRPVAVLRKALLARHYLWVYTTSHRARCPRLSVRLLGVDVDVVFAACREWRALAQGSQSVEDVLASMPRNSRAGYALEGVRQLRYVVRAVRERGMAMSTFCAALRFAVEVLRAHGAYGKVFQLPRTFHIARLLADCVRAGPCTGGPDALFVALAQRVAGATEGELGDVFGRSVPFPFVRRFHRVMADCALVQPLWTAQPTPPVALTRLLMRRMPTSGCVRLGLDWGCAVSPRVEWVAAHSFEAVAAGAIRQLVEEGVAVQPGCSRGGKRLVFSVPDSPEGVLAAREAVAMLRERLLEFVRSTQLADERLDFHCHQL